MTIVGFDTSMSVTTGCVLLGDDIVYQMPMPPAARLMAPPQHSAELLPALDGLLREVRLSWKDVDLIAVGVGPGTFTGLRIGVATARALGHALDTSLAPVSSLEALAAGIVDACGPPSARPLLPLIDARRRQVFASLYRTGEPLRCEWGPLALAREELLERLTALEQPPLAAGDWALESRKELEAANVEVPPADSGVHAVNALYICRLARSVEPVSAEEIKPVYVRLPDAEINRRLAQGE